MRVDLVLSDAADISELSHNLFNQCCHFVYGDAAMWLKIKCVQHSKKAIFMQNFAMSMTPDTVIVNIKGGSQKFLGHYKSLKAI